MRLDSTDIAEIVRVALAEDVGTGDVTTRCTVPEDRESRGNIVAKEDGVVAGLDVACEVFRQVDDRIECVPLVEDSFQVRVNGILAEVSGPARGILTAERTALNFLQRLSGIATLTQRYVQAVAGTGAEILDTRKTSPGLRRVEKYAVAIGGGRNHRFGLFDMVLLKDNHLRIGGGVREAVAACRKSGNTVFIEVEVRTTDELREAIEADVDRIMLDNMDLEKMRQAVALVKKATRGRKGIEVEASGGITLQTVRGVAETGVDFVSVGALTHSAAALDISFNVT